MEIVAVAVLAEEEILLMQAEEAEEGEVPISLVTEIPEVGVMKIISAGGITR
jgi:hypothetical protein